MSRDQNLMTDASDKTAQRRKKGIIPIIIAAAAVLLLGGIGVWLLSRSGEGDGSDTAVAGSMPRESALALARDFISRGEYEQAQRLLDMLLKQDASDTEAAAMRGDIAALLQGVPLSNFPQYAAGSALDSIRQEYAEQEAALAALDEEIAKLRANEANLTEAELARLEALESEREALAQAHEETGNTLSQMAGTRRDSGAA